MCISYEIKRSSGTSSMFNQLMMTNPKTIRNGRKSIQQQYHQLQVSSTVQKCLQSTLIKPPVRMCLNLARSRSFEKEFNSAFPVTV